MYSYLDKLQVGKKALRHLWGGGARVLPIHGEVAPKAPEGLVVLCNVSSHSWGGGAEGAGGARCALQRVLPIHDSWGGGAEGAGGARCALQRVLPIHGEVAPKAPEGLECLTRSRAMQLRSHRPRSRARHRQR